MDKQRVIPVLRMYDVAKAKEFYVDWLGFTIDWEHRFGENFPLYMQVSKNGAVLHLSEHYGDCSPGAKTLIEMPGLKNFHASLKEYKYFKPAVEKAAWGDWSMELIDPFTNKLIFTEEVKE